MSRPALPQAASSPASSARSSIYVSPLKPLPKAPQEPPNRSRPPSPLRKVRGVSDIKSEGSARTSTDSNGSAPALNGAGTTKTSGATRSNANKAHDKVDYRIAPIHALPSAQIASTMAPAIQRTILRRKRRHLNLVLEQRDKLMLDMRRMHQQWADMCMELSDLQKDMDEMEAVMKAAEEVALESSDEEWLARHR